MIKIGVNLSLSYRFASTKTITVKKAKGSDTIAMVKKSSKVNYGYQGGSFNIKDTYRKN